MPAFDSEAWWKFVKSLFSRVLGFGLRAIKAVPPSTRKGGVVTSPSTCKYAVVPNSFWGARGHSVDVMAVIELHRERTRQAATSGAAVAPATHNGRPFGQQPARLRRCDMCPPGHPAVMCVRQLGSQWLCMRPPADAGPLASCHRNFHLPIDVGYLDVEIPSGAQSDLTMEEIMAADQLLHHRKACEDEEEEEKKEQEGRRPMFEGVPQAVLRLLADLGFTGAKLTVTAEEMKAAWVNAADVEYLSDVDDTYDSTLVLLARARDALAMKRVRPCAFKVFNSCGLLVQTGRTRESGNRQYTYTLTR
jgi:hypothetical protein